MSEAGKKTIKKEGEDDDNNETIDTKSKKKRKIDDRDGTKEENRVESNKMLIEWFLEENITKNSLKSKKLKKHAELNDYKHLSDDNVKEMVKHLYHEFRSLNYKKAEQCPSVYIQDDVSDISYLKHRLLPIICSFNTGERCLLELYSGSSKQLPKKNEITYGELMGAEFRLKCILAIKLPKSKLKINCSDGTKYNLKSNEDIKREIKHNISVIDISHCMNLMIKDTATVDYVKNWNSLLNDLLSFRASGKKIEIFKRNNTFIKNDNFKLPKGKSKIRFSSLF